MLEELNIKNFALIESAHIEFDKGFTVLSGETGAGKSILIGALSFLLGGKGGTDVIRAGSSEARVSGTFVINDKNKEATHTSLKEVSDEIKSAFRERNMALLKNKRNIPSASDMRDTNSRV